MRLAEAITDNSHKPGRKRHIAHLVGDLAVILMEINPSNGAIVKSYIHANGQILAQHDGDHTAESYFYLHDRLGSVRQLINSYGYVHKYYTYEPFGETIESGGSFEDPFRFTGQYHDQEIAEYYLRARQYNPNISRFTSRDPVFGKFEQPLTLHKYLYCGNDSVNRIDPAGLWAAYVTGTFMASAGGSFIRQSGFVFDEQGNIGWMNLTGGGLGTQTLSAGISFGYSPNARTIDDLGGWFHAAGGSLTMGLSIGVERFQGVDTDIYGWEVTFAGSTGGLFGEGHGHRTHTTIYSLNEEVAAIGDYMDDMLMGIDKYSDWLLYNAIYGYIWGASGGRYDLKKYEP